jgi:murein L,D-transpeptidase YafK
MKLAYMRGMSSIFRKLLPYFLTCCIFFYNGVAFASLGGVDKVVVIKSERILMLLQKGSVVKTYKVCLGRNPLGRKTKEGDNRTPEGIYKLDGRNPKSKFHMSLHVSYPSKADRLIARRLGVSPGGNIMIHGFPDGITMDDIPEHLDWTKGCIAVANSAIEEIWQLVPNGTPIEILP